MSRSSYAKQYQFNSASLIYLVVDISTGKRQPFEEATDLVVEPDETADITAGVDDQESASSSESSSTVSDNELVRGEVQVRWEAVVSIIEKLYRFSTDIRNSSTRSGPGDRAPFANEPVEKQAEYLEQLAQIETGLVERQLARCREAAKTCLDEVDDLVRQAYRELVARLAKANVIRRQHFLYWHEQSNKRSDCRRGAIDPGKSTPHEPVPHGTQNLLDRPRRDLQRPKSLKAPSNPTSVTKLDPKKVRPGGTSVFSRASANKPVQSPAGDEVPWPGIEDLAVLVQNASHFECPYCSLMCPAAYGKSLSSWRFVRPLP